MVRRLIRHWSLIRVPLVRALGALEERCHRFIGGADLDLFEVRTVVLAVVIVHALHSRLINVLPSVSASQDVVDLFSLKSQFVLELLLNYEHIRASFAVEAEIVGGLFGEEDVGARRAKEHLLSTLSFH